MARENYRLRLTVGSARVATSFVALYLVFRLLDFLVPTDSSARC